MRALDVYLHRKQVGQLLRGQGAQLSFTYESGWVEHGAPISLSLPLRAEPFSDPECRPFFSGLLPEGDFLRAVARALGVSAENPFSVLEQIGGECAGAVSLAAPGVAPPFDRSPPPRWLQTGDLKQLLEELPMRPLLIGIDGDEVLRLSLAGTRNKLPVLAQEKRLGITRGKPPSSHIVKKPDLDLPELVANEAYCLALARASGLEAAKANPIAAGKQEGLLVERYDRATTSEEEGKVRRLHQEDFCQALGLGPEQKYQGEGGPGVADCATLLRTHAAAPGKDLLAFLDALLFNLMIRNSDAHGKNYSLLLDGDGTPRLAPLYDLLSASVYGGRYGRKMAMKYGGEYRPRYLRGRHLDRLAGELAISERTVRSCAVELSTRVLSARPEARRSLPDAWQEAPLLDAIDTTVEEAAETLRCAVAEPA